MALEIIGKIIQIMPTSTGTSKAGKDWIKQEFVIETQEQYPKKICISAMGEKTDALKKFTTGNEVKVAINLESREYNGKWYTNVNAWKIESAGTGAATSSPAEDPFHPGAETDISPDNVSSGDDLPF